MKPSFLTIGHITQDLLPDGSLVPGGTVTFAARTAQALGERGAIVTAGPGQLRADPLFEAIEIAGPNTPTATIFENIYTGAGRQQFVRAVAPVITAQDVPQEWRQAGVVLLGPVAQECGDDLFGLFPDALVGLTPQGFMRQWDASSGLVRPIEWSKADRLLPLVDALILSTEDLPSGPDGTALLARYVQLCPLVVCTFGPLGCEVYQRGEPERVSGYPTQEINPTGAGDVFAAAFLLHLKATADPLAAARFANSTAARHIAGTGL